MLFAWGLKSPTRYRLQVGPENSMTKAENVNADGASKGSGCGCAPKVAAPASGAAKTGCWGGGHDHSADGHPDPESTANVLDPVCGMNVNPATSQHRFDY